MKKTMTATELKTMNKTTKTSKKAPMTALHPVIAKLLESNITNKSLKFNAKHDWLEYTSFTGTSGVDVAIATCKDADIQSWAFEAALSKLKAQDGEHFEVVYYNIKTGEKFRPELVIESVKLSPARW